MENLKAKIKDGKYTIIDVRSRQEFQSGSVANAINIPVGELESKLADLENFQQPLILCCASGMRSGNAAHFLLGKGFDVYNGGSWMELNYLIQQ